MRGSRDACEACDGGIVAHLSPERQNVPLFACERGASPNRPYPPPGDVHVGYVSEYERGNNWLGLGRISVLHFFASDTIRMSKALRRTARARPHLHPLADVRRLRTGSSSH